MSRDHDAETAYVKFKEENVVFVVVVIFVVAVVDKLVWKSQSTLALKKQSLDLSRWTKYEINWYETLNFGRI